MTIGSVIYAGGDSTAACIRGSLRAAYGACVCHSTAGTLGMKAIISDIHGNLEALEAVLRAVSYEGVDEIWCLGDIVGYGPNPIECVDLVKNNCSLCLMGNHDWAAVNRPVGFNSAATLMIYRTKEWMQVTDKSTEEEKNRWQFLESLPLREVREPFLLVHASPRAELSEYIPPSDVRREAEKLRDIFGMLERYCMVGHTHLPCCIFEDMDILIPEGTGYVVELGDRKTIINTGSVGQPRDGDNRACFITLDDNIVTYHRVAYNFNRTAEKLQALGENYAVLGYRLSVGR
jgi:predicted phosphodiesterase